MTQSINTLKNKSEIIKVLGEDVARNANHHTYFYHTFKAGMSFRRNGNQIVYYTIGQKY